MLDSTSPSLTSTAVQPAMRDGTLLAADLYLPDGDGPFPTLVRKTPYVRTRPQVRPDIEHFAAHGYAVLVVSMRGRHGSQGEFRELRNEGWQEHPDGYDTIEWAAVQTWSNGAIGTFGVSSDGQWQLSTAPTRPPHLKAMFVSYASNPRGAVIDGGLMTHTGPGWFSMEGEFARQLRNRDDWRAWLVDWKVNQLPLLASFIHPELIEVLTYKPSDPYWSDIDPSSRYGDFSVPVMHECGWYDRYPKYHLRHFEGVRAAVKDERVRSSQRVIFGPWVHGGMVAPETDEVQFGPAAELDRQEFQRRWFDCWLKDEPNGVVDEAPVRIYLMGAEEWIEAPDWPISGTRSERLYLRGGNGSSPQSLNDGSLSKEPPGQEEPDAYDHDPFDPVDSIGGHGGTGWVWPAGPLDQRPVEVKSLTYTTPPLAEDLDLVGEMEVSLSISSSAEDTDFIVTLSDVYPSGYSAILRQNGLRASCREGEDNPQPLVPNQNYRLEFSLAPVANRFLTGHRLRIAIASSSFPAYIPNAGTVSNAHLAALPLVARNVVHHTKGNESYINLPVI